MLASCTAERFVALDVHKHYVVVGAVNVGQQVVLSPRRVDLDEFLSWSQQHLYSTDAVVLEATTNAWHLCDQLRPLVSFVTVAHPLLVKVITAARVKADARDTLHLARLLAAGLIPAVWVPPQEVRELRALGAHRTRLIRQRTQAKNRLRSTLHRYNLLPPAGGLFAPAQRAWWESLALSASEKLRIRQDLCLLDSLEPLIEEVEAELTRLSGTERWRSQVTFLLQLPGIGVLNALVLLAAIGDITRFPAAKQLVGYARLGAGVHASRQTYQTGHITKQGRKEMRAALVEAAWMAVEHHPHWKEQFERLATRIGKKKAIVAIARKLLVIIWHVLSKQEADRHADQERVARTIMEWARTKSTATKLGLSRLQFVRRELDRLGIGTEMDSFVLGSRTFHLPKSASDG
ncbi:MAG: IS110 family transposase [Ktedonobacteraceae bacterium]